MKIKTLTVKLLTSLLTAISVQAQGTFQNLNFEEANPVSAGDPYAPDAVTVSSALPYWTVSYGNAPQNEIQENNYSLGSTAVTLLGPGHEADTATLDGNYSVLLQGGITASSASISQNGFIPSSAHSLFFEAQPPAITPGGGPLHLVIGSQNVPYFAVEAGPNYMLYAADISAWAGQNQTVTFSALEDLSPNNWTIDDISFSSTAVPEPSPLVLAGVGTFLFAAYRHFVVKRKQS